MTNFILENEDGWYRNLPTNLTAPSDRVFTRTSITAGLLFFTTYTPDENLCKAEGSSDLYALDLTTGTATGFGVFAEASDDTGLISDVSIDLGAGRASEVVLFSGGTLGSSKGRAIVQQDNGKLTNLPANLRGPISVNTSKRAWREIILD